MNAIHRIRFSLFRLLVLLLPLGASLPSDAQQRLERPLCFVPADSTLVWGLADSNLGATALSIDRRIDGRPFTAGAVSDRAFREALRAWTDSIVPSLDLTGVSRDAQPGEQALAAASTLEAAARLFLLTGEAGYAEAMERVLFNALLAEVPAGRPLTPMRHVAARALRRGAGTMYACAADAPTVYVNYYANSSTHIVVPGADFMMEQLTGMPHSGRVRLRIDRLAGVSARIRLCLRIPAWALHDAWPASRFAAGGDGQPFPVVYVNGKEPLGERQMQGGYLVIDRVWNSGDEVLFDLPVRPFFVRRQHRGHAVRGSVAVQRGPFVYAPVDGLPEGCCFSSSAALSEEEVEGGDGSVVLHGRATRDADTPADAVAPAVPLTLLPYKDVRGTVWLREAH